MVLRHRDDSPKERAASTGPTLRKGYETLNIPIFSDSNMFGARLSIRESAKAPKGREGASMRSYAVVVCGRLLGLLVPGLPAATPDSQHIKMLGAMRRQQKGILPAAPGAAAAGGRPHDAEAGRARGSESGQHRAGLSRVPRDVRRDSVHPLARAGDPAREERPEPRGEVMHVKPARLVAKVRQQVRPFVQECAI